MKAAIFKHLDLPTPVSRMVTDDTSASLARVLSSLGRRFDTPENKAKFTHHVTNGSGTEKTILLGPQTLGKTRLEEELAALASRISLLEARASLADTRTLPLTPNEQDTSAGITPLSEELEVLQKKAPPPQSHTRSRSDSKALQGRFVSNILSGHELPSDGHQKTVELTEEQMKIIRDHVSQQAEQIRVQKEYVDNVSKQLTRHQLQTDKAIGGLNNNVEDIDSLKRELLKHQQANMAFQKSLREIGNIITAVANGDLSKKVLIHKKELDPEITVFKTTINTMVDQLQEFALQVSHLARETGTEGRLGGQAVLPGVSGKLAMSVSVHCLFLLLSRVMALESTPKHAADMTQRLHWRGKIY